MEYGIWNMEYGVWSMEYGVWSMGDGRWKKTKEKNMLIQKNYLSACKDLGADTLVQY